MSLEALLQDCTVKLSPANQQGWGTGFFVAPGLILTCAHVVKGPVDSVRVRWRQQDDFAEALLIERDLEWDLALLQLLPETVDRAADLPCVVLDDEARAGQDFYFFGYPDREFDHGCPVTGSCEGLTGDVPPLIKFKLAQVRPGMSGSALLNRQTGKVCGMVKFTRDRASDLGGGAIPSAVILRRFPQLRSLQQEFHRRDRRWQQLMEQRKLPRRPSEGRQLSRQEYRSRQNLLTQTRTEVESRLSQSLHRAALRLNLGKEQQPQQVQRPWDMSVKVGEQRSVQLPPQTTILDVFEDPTIAGKFLILGKPGGGKTTTLLELAEALVERAEGDSDAPIPVILELSSWQEVTKREFPKFWEQQKYDPSIQEWVLFQLVSKGVSRDIGEQWLREKELVLLLDGLDELQPERQGKCVRAINQFLDGEFLPLHLVVCSRKEEYEVYEEKLYLNGAIYLDDLTNGQIQNYFTSVSLGDFWESIRNSEKIVDFIRQPLFLAISSLACQVIDIEEWRGYSTEKMAINYLLDAYKLRVLNSSTLKKFKNKYDDQSLILLANHFQENSISIEGIQNIDPIEFLSLINKGNQWLVFELILAVIILLPLVIGTLSIIVFALFIIVKLPYNWFSYSFYASFITMLATLCFIFTIIMAVFFMIPQLGFLYWLAFFPFLSSEMPSIPWSDNLFIGEYQGEGKVLSLSLVSIWLLSIFAFVISSYLLSGLFSILPAFIVILLPPLLLKYYVSRLLLKDRPLFKSRIKNIFLNMLFSIAVSGIYIILLCYAMSTSGKSDNFFRIDNPRAIISIGLIFGLYFGMVWSDGISLIKYFVFRLILWINGIIPWNVNHLLDYYTDCLILQRVGNRYQFIHRLVQEYFANLEIQPKNSERVQPE